MKLFDLVKMQQLDAGARSQASSLGKRDTGCVSKSSALSTWTTFFGLKLIAYDV